MERLQTSITLAYRIEHASHQQETEDQARRDLSLVIENLISPTLFSADVDEHDHKQKQHHHAADINEYLHTRNELRAREHKQRRHRYERRNQKQRAMNRIARHDSQQSRKDRRESEDPEEERFVS